MVGGDLRVHAEHPTQSLAHTRAWQVFRPFSP